MLVLKNVKKIWLKQIWFYTLTDLGRPATQWGQNKTSKDFIMVETNQCKMIFYKQKKKGIAVLN